MTDDDYDYYSLGDELIHAEDTFSRVRRYAQEKLARLRLGVYSEEREGNLQEVLEEIERSLR